VRIPPISDDPSAYLDAWQSVDSDDLSAIASATAEGVPLAVANRAFGKDALKPVIACPPKPWRRWEELYTVLVA
jgi:hypothetical protein